MQPTIQFPEKMPLEVRKQFSPEALKDDSKFVKRLQALPHGLYCDFMKIFASDNEWQNRYPSLKGRIQQIHETSYEILTEADKTLKAPPISTIDKIKQTYFLIIAVSRRNHDLDLLYSHLVKIPIPLELRLSALQDDLSSFQENLQKFPISERELPSEIREIGKQMLEITEAIQQQTKEYERKFGKEQLQEQIWNQYFLVIRAKCKNGLRPFLLKDLKLLGIPHDISNAMAEKGREILDRADREKSVPENKSTIEDIQKRVDSELVAAFWSFRSLFIDYLLNLDKSPVSTDSYCLLQALLKMYKEEEQMPLSSDRTEIGKTPSIPVPGRRSSRYKPLTEETCKRIWAEVRNFIDMNRTGKIQLMGKLAELPLPPHLKILAISPEYDSEISSGESKWEHYFTKHSQNLSPQQREKLLNNFEQFSEIFPSSTSPESPPETIVSGSSAKNVEEKK